MYYLVYINASTSLMLPPKKFQISDNFIEVLMNFGFSFFLRLCSDMHKDLCRGMSGLCDAMRPTKGADLLKYLRKVNFTGKNFTTTKYFHNEKIK